MEIVVEYNGLQERQVKVKEQEAKGLRMLHDNFHSDWKSGDEPRGTMTFTDIMPPTSPPPRDLEAEIDAIKARIEKLEKIK